MKKFIRDNLTNSFNFPSDYNEEFSLILVGDKLVGSVNETLTPIELALTSKHVRDAFDREENNLVQRLLGKINNLTEFEQVN